MGTDQRGSVLLLMPAAVLVVFVLAALSVDRAVVFGAQRDLVADAEAAANDAVAAGVSPEVLHAEGRIELDPARVDAEVDRVVEAADRPTRSQWHVEGDVVVVRLEQDVALVFSPVPGGADTVTVHATARAELRRRGP